MTRQEWIDYVTTKLTAVNLLTADIKTALTNIPDPPIVVPPVVTTELNEHFVTPRPVVRDTPATYRDGTGRIGVGATAMGRINYG